MAWIPPKYDPETNELIAGGYDDGSTDPYANNGGSEFGVVDPNINWDPVTGGYVDASGNPVNADGTPIASYSNEGNNYPTPGSTQGPGGSPVNSSADTSTSDLTKYLQNLLGTKMTGAQMASLGLVGAGGLAGALTNLNKPKITPVGYQGGIPKLVANRTMVTAPPPGHVPGSGGVNYGGDVTYTPKGAAAVSSGLAGDVGGDVAYSASAPQLQKLLTSSIPTANIADQQRATVQYEDYAKNNEARLASKMAQGPDSTADFIAPTMTAQQYASQRNVLPELQAGQGYAQGGLMGLAHGGSAGQYLQGSTDGMADKLPTSIDGKQPAALSHGEFVVPADVVSHLGNGNSDAGAKKLYSMMDKIRQARTGTKKQGKQINPDKFMPGGSVGYAEGGSVRHFATGDAVTGVPAGTTGVEQTMAGWTGDYVPNMLAQGQALSNAPYQQYTGQLTAGPSDLQNQAFGAASNLQAPSAIGQAANTAGGIAGAAQNMSYNPMQATSQYQAPAAYQAGNFGSQFTAPTQSAATNFTNQYQAPTPYQNTNFSSGTFGNDQAQQYMNPYLQQSLNPQLTEARRQSDITAAQNNAAMTKAGAFGGGRQAILTAENQRNLGTNLANITGQGYNTAYTNAMSQYNADQGRGLQAQQATEASKQFGATQGMNAAQLMAQYGLSAQQAQEAARQFNQGQAMTGAQSAAQYGLAGQQATEASKQFGANQGLTSAQNAAQYGQAAQQANIGQQQFGANLGLQGLQLANQAAQTQGNLGTAQNQAGLSNINAQAGLGATQQGITQAGLTADQAAFAAARDNPYKMLQFQQSLLNGLPISATNYSTAQTSDLANLAGGATTVNQLLTTLGLSPTQTGAAPATTPAK